MTLCLHNANNINPNQNTDKQKSNNNILLFMNFNVLWVIVNLIILKTECYIVIHSKATIHLVTFI